MSTLRILPCLDSDAMAESRRRELDIPRAVAAELGRSALAASESGSYTTSTGRVVDWRDAVAGACAAKRSIPPDARLYGGESHAFAVTEVWVTNETTLGAARRLVEAGERPMALNFANGVCPGGGFLHGARAQEETLCRSSALYRTLAGDPMYAEHRKRGLADSTDWAILSPDVPVFRTDDGRALDGPWLLAFVTCAAPVAKHVGLARAGELLQHRIDRVLAIARSSGYTALVLGAWGCGAFGNDARRTAADFRNALERRFSGAFSRVVFAITDWSLERRFLGPFRDAFPAGGSV